MAGLACIAGLACGSSEAPERVATRRLTAEEWQHTVRDLVGVTVDRAVLPVDELTAGFPNNVAGSVGEFDIENLLGAAEAVATEATRDLPALLGCAEATRDCVASWAPGFLDRAYRRPTSEEERSEFLDLYDQGPDHDGGVRLMLAGALVSGSFLYRPETGGTRVGDTVELNDFEIASRLSYLLWRSMPDEALFEAAREDRLSSSRDITAQARRMLADPKAGQAIGSFTLDWLGMANAGLLDRLPSPEDAEEIERVQMLDTPLEQWEGGGVLSAGEHREDAAVWVATSPAVARYPTDLGASFTVRGRMMVEDEGASVGLRVLDGPPEDPRFYRFGRTAAGTFTLSSNPEADCSDETQFSAAPGEWVEFEIAGNVGNLDNEVQVRLWALGEAPERRPFLACRDSSAGRPTRGDVALWAEGPGRKWWAQLQLQTVRPVPFDFGPLAEAYLAETKGFVATWLADGGALQELVSADWTMANQTVAEAYGISGVTGAELRRVSLPPERVGILTQPLFLSTFAKADQSSPTLRGMTVRSSVLCELLATPPPDVAVIAPDPSPDATTRERFAQHTEDPSCASCHLLMDPIGFGFEHFDQLGMYRDDENGLPIDATGEIVGGEAAGTFDDVHGLVDRLGQSSAVRQCMVTQWYRYAMARLERDSGEAALDDALRVCERDRCTLEEVVTTIVTSDAFRTRAAHEGDPR